MKTKLLTCLVSCSLLFTLVGCSQNETGKVGEKWINAEVEGNLTKSTKVSLQDDFYAASNADWILSASIPEGKSYEGGLLKYQDTLDDQLRSLINNNEISSNEEQIVSDLYNMSLDWNSRNAYGIEPLKPYMDAITSIDSINTLTQYLESNSSLGSNLISVMSDYSVTDSNIRVLYINEFETIYSDPNDYKKLSSYGKTEEQYSKSVSTYLLQRLGYSKSQAKKMYQSCIDFEAKLAPYNYSIDEQNNSNFSSKTIRNEYSLEKIQKIAKQFPVVDILKSEGFDVAQVYGVYNPRSLKSIAKVFNEKYIDQIKNYLIIHTLLDTVKYLDYDAYAYATKKENEIQGISGMISDEEYALSVVQENTFDALDTLYTENYCSQELKQDIESMIQTYLSYYEDMLNNEKWLSKATRYKAIEKLKAIQGHASYPEKHRDYSTFTLHDLASNGSYMDAMSRIYQFKEQVMIDTLKTDKNTQYWVEDEQLGASTINAFYDPSSNDIFICNGLLVSLGYDINWSKEEKLATLGFVIGHELSHAFDPSGAKYDKDGNTNLWWKESELETFEERAQKLSDYMSQIQPENGSDEYVNGQQVRNETVADITGFQATLRIANDINDFNYDTFFKNYSFMWARIEKASYQIYLMNEDVHALVSLRANVVLQQFDKFLDTYNIQKGDGMYLAKKDRLTVW